MQIFHLEKDACHSLKGIPSGDIKGTPLMVDRLRRILKLFILQISRDYRQTTERSGKDTLVNKQGDSVLVKLEVPRSFYRKM